jgi:hypothetical protein
MKVTFVTRDYANVSGGHNTWLCRFLPNLRRRGIESRVLCFHLSPEEEFPTVRSLRQAGFSCITERASRDNTVTAAVELFLKRHVAGQRKGARCEREIRAELLSRWSSRCTPSPDAM